MQNIFVLQFYCAFIALVGINEVAGAVSVNTHLVRQKRIEGSRVTTTVTDYLCVGIAPQEQVAHHSFTEHEGCHLAVGFIMKQRIERMPRHC